MLLQLDFDFGAIGSLEGDFLLDLSTTNINNSWMGQDC